MESAGGARPEIPALTGLRFIAALTVLISHSVATFLALPGNEHAWHLAILDLAGIGMPLFFVLSGFVIHYNYAEQIRGRGAAGLANFFVARFARLYPLYAVCVTFELIFGALYHKLTPGAAQAIPYYATLTQSWFYADHGDTTLIFQIGRMSAVSWSISTEWLFYLAYPICIGVLPRPRNPWGIGLASIAVAAVGIAAVAAIALAAPGVERAATDWYGPVATRGGERFYLWLIGYSPYPRLAQFLLGCLAASLYLRLRDRPVSQREQRLGWWTTIAAVGATLVLYLLYYVATAVLAGTQTILSTPVDLDKFPRWILILFSLGGGAGLAPVIAIAVFGVARYRNPIVSWLSAPTLLLCGEASYSLYLLHPAMLGAFANTIGPVTSFGIGVANLLALGLAMASAIGLSLVSWRCLEVPARRWLRRILTVRLPPKPELAA